MRILVNDNLMTQNQINEIIDLLFKDNCDDLEIIASKSLVNSSIYKDGKLYIEYVNKSYIFRSIFNYATKINHNNKVAESLYFKDLTVMFDCSRNAVPNLDFLKKMIRFMRF